MIHVDLVNHLENTTIHRDVVLQSMPNKGDFVDVGFQTYLVTMVRHLDQTHISKANVLYVVRRDV